MELVLKQTGAKPFCLGLDISTTKHKNIFFIIILIEYTVLEQLN